MDLSLKIILSPFMITKYLNEKQKRWLYYVAKFFVIILIKNWVGSTLSTLFCISFGGVLAILTTANNFVCNSESEVIGFVIFSFMVSPFLFAFRFALEAKVYQYEVRQQNKLHSKEL